MRTDPSTDLYVDVDKERRDDQNTRGGGSAGSAPAGDESPRRFFGPHDGESDSPAVATTGGGQQVVAKGDTLWGLAQGRKEAFGRLISGMGGNPDAIAVGQSIVRDDNISGDAAIALADKYFAGKTSTQTSVGPTAQSSPEVEPGAAQDARDIRLTREYKQQVENVLSAINPAVQETVDSVTTRAKTREYIFAAKHWFDAEAIGEFQKGSDNISTIATRFARQGASPSGDSILEVRTGVFSADGDGNGAFRHAFWMAMITKSYGPDIAMEVGYAHEDDPTVVNSKQRVFAYSDMPRADTLVDLLNNGIGRSIGMRATQSASNLDLANAVIDEYFKNGLYTATPTPDGGWYVSKTLLSQDQYLQFKTALNQKDNFGNWLPKKK